MKELETTNQSLKNKIKVLRIQLESQSHLHATGCPYSQKGINSVRISQSTSAINVCCNKSNSKEPFDTSKNHESTERIIPISQYESVTCQLQNVHKELQQSQARILDLEQELAKKNYEHLSPAKIKSELCENVEIIKLKRSNKKQAAEISSLQLQLNTLANENKQLHSSVNYYNEQREHLLLELSKEKNESTNLTSELSLVKANAKLLEEQLNDIQNERSVLKEHNDNLLKLSLQTDMKSKSDIKTKFLYRIKELEESLKNEIIAKTDLQSKLVDAETLIAKFKEDGTQQSSMILHLQKHNSFLQNQYTEVNDKCRRYSDIVYDSTVKIPKENKATMTVEDEKCIENKQSETDGVQSDRHTCSMKLQLTDRVRELNQCKELLFVQYTLNNKLKKQIEEVQKMFYNMETLNANNIQLLYDILQNHKNHMKNTLSTVPVTENKVLSEIITIFESTKSASISKNLKILTDILKLYEEFVRQHICSNISNNEHKHVEYITSSVNTENKQMRDTDVQTNDFHVNEDIDNKKPLVRRGSYVIENDKPAEFVDQIDTLISETDQNMTFEFHIDNIVFEEFPQHLQKTSKPRVFLTWVFFNDYEQQSYTCSRPINNAPFDCTYQYKGQSSHSFYKYLKDEGIHIEVHLVQGDISVRIADAVIDTSEVLSRLNEKCNYLGNLRGANISGNINCWFLLTSSDQTLTEHLQ